MPSVFEVASLSNAPPPGREAEVQALFSATGSAFVVTEELQRPHALVLAAAATGRGACVGALLAWFVADELHLLHIAVAEAWRRQGVARRLLEEALTQARQRGARIAVLEVRATNIAAKALYASAGFSLARLRPRYYENPVEDGLELTLAL
jgi:ribosomal-protein-alanine N-acetyltransferase